MSRALIRDYPRSEAVLVALSAVYIHLVFSTKHRRPLLRDAARRGALHACLGLGRSTVAATPLGFNGGNHIVGGGMGMTERGGFPNELNLRRGQAVCLVGEVAERALQLQGFGGAGAGGLNAGGIPFHEAMDRYKNTVRKILRMLERQSPD